MRFKKSRWAAASSLAAFVAVATWLSVLARASDAPGYSSYASGDFFFPPYASDADRMGIAAPDVSLYNPALRQEFRYIYQAQYEEFVRLYGRHPSHVDGHQHKHLCANILLGGVIPPAVKIRRNFSFWPGEKSLLNRGYRKLVDRWLARRYTMTNFFFSLQQSLQRDRLARVFDLAHAATVELMTHPVNQGELAYLMSDACAASLSQIRVGTYAEL
jgi:hypothetical protein